MPLRCPRVRGDRVHMRTAPRPAAVAPSPVVVRAALSARVTRPPRRRRVFHLAVSTLYDLASPALLTKASAAAAYARNGPRLLGRWARTSSDYLASALPVRGVCCCRRSGRTSVTRKRSVLLPTVAKITERAAGGYAEYLEGKAQPGELGDYLRDGERVEAPGRWAAGAAAVDCNPDAGIADGQFASVAGRAPPRHRW